MTKDDKGQLVMHPNSIPREVVKHGQGLPCVDYKQRLDGQASKNAKPVKPEDYYYYPSTGFMEKPNLTPVVFAARREFGVTLTLEEILKRNNLETTVLTKGMKALDFGVPIGKSNSATLEAYVKDHLSGAHWASKNDYRNKGRGDSEADLFKDGPSGYEATVTAEVQAGWGRLKGWVESNGGKATLVSGARSKGKQYLMYGGNKKAAGEKFRGKTEKNDYNTGVIWDHGDDAETIKHAKITTEAFGFEVKASGRGIAQPDHSKHSMGTAIDVVIDGLPQKVRIETHHSKLSKAEFDAELEAQNSWRSQSLCHLYFDLLTGTPVVGDEHSNCLLHQWYKSHFEGKGMARLYKHLGLKKTGSHNHWELP